MILIKIVNMKLGWSQILMYYFYINEFPKLLVVNGAIHQELKETIQIKIFLMKQ